MARCRTSTTVEAQELETRLDRQTTRFGRPDPPPDKKRLLGAACSLRCKTARTGMHSHKEYLPGWRVRAIQLQEILLSAKATMPPCPRRWTCVFCLSSPVRWRFCRKRERWSPPTPPVQRKAWQSLTESCCCLALEWIATSCQFDAKFAKSC